MVLNLFKILRRPQCLANAFKVQKSAFWSLGVDPTSLETPVISRLRLLLPMTSMSTLCVFILLYCIRNIGDINEATNAFIPFLQSVLAILKINIFLYRRKLMIPLLQRILRTLKETSDQAELDILADENWVDIRFSCFFYVVVLWCGTSALYGPFLSGAIMYWQNGEFELEPPVKAAYPWDINKSYWNYAGAHLWCDTGAYMAIYGSITMDTLFSFIVCNVIAQFRLLEHRLGLIADKPAAAITVADYSRCVQNHLDSIRLAEELRDVYAPIVFAKFLISCLQLCFLVYQFNRGAPMGEMIFYGLFLVACAVQLFLYCANGQRVKDASEDISKAFYNTFKVENCRRIPRHYLLIPMVRASRGCELTGVFFNVDLSMYVWVFRTAASFITMLWTLEEK